MKQVTLSNGIDWIVSSGLVEYPDALAWMEARATSVAVNEAREAIWLLEHPPLYTAGTSADPKELLDNRFPVFAAGRGGRYTYHGPGQRVVYLVLDVGKRGRDVRCFVHAVEDWVIATLAQLGVPARRVPGRVGIWTDCRGQEAKIGAIGIRIRRWVSLHGFALNIAPNLSHFGGIVPCGLPDFPVTSLADLGVVIDNSAFDEALLNSFHSFINNLETLPKK